MAKPVEPTLVTVCNAKRGSICSICVKTGQVIHHQSLTAFMLLEHNGSMQLCTTLHF